MEEIKEDLLSSDDELPIDELISKNLLATSRWARFITICFYSCTAFAIICFSIYLYYISTRYGSLFNPINSDYIMRFIVIVVIVVAVVGITWYYLLAFANKIRNGLDTESVETVNDGLRSLTIHYKLIAVLLIIGLLVSIYQLSQ